MCHCGNMGMEQTPNKSRQIKLTPEKKILLPLLPGFELATFPSQVQHSTSKLSLLPTYFVNNLLNDKHLFLATIQHRRNHYLLQSTFFFFFLFSFTFIEIRCVTGYGSLNSCVVTLTLVFLPSGAKACKKRSRLQQVISNLALSLRTFSFP